MNSNIKVLSCRGLQPLKEGDKIYGRDAEIKDLSERVQENLHTILYGQSGAGKSSLIEAGVFPILRRNGYFPVIVRFLEIDASDFVEYVISQVRQEALKNGYILKSLVSDADMNESTMLSFFQGTVFEDNAGERYIPVLVFDQFEEVLNNPDTYQRGEDFIKNIYPLIDDSFCLNEDYLEYSNYRILFSMREDFLYAFEDILDKNNLSELKQNRVRLRFLDKDGAEYVVKKILYGSSDNFSDAEELDCLAQDIVYESENTSYSFGISTSVLSLICYQIIKNGLSPRDIDKKVIESIIYNFYDDAVGPMSYKCRRFIEDKLITKDGRRASVDMRDAQNNGDISQIDVDKLVNDTRILSIINIGNTKRLEFSHDIIVRIVNRKRSTIWQAIMSVLKKPFQFSGSASKEEFFAYFSFYCLCFLVLYYLRLLGLRLLEHFEYYEWLYNINYSSYMVYRTLAFLFLLPLISVTVRRLHAVRRSGWWILVPFVPLVWASRQDNIRPYRGALSNVPPFELLMDWKTPLLRKSCDRITYAARQLYAACFSVWLTVIGVYVALMFASTEELTNAYPQSQNFFLISDLKAFFTIYDPGGIIVILAALFYIMLISSELALCMRLPRMGFRRFWAFIPIVSLPLWIYGFWPDSHFAKQNRKSFILILIIFSILLFCFLCMGFHESWNSGR